MRTVLALIAVAGCSFQPGTLLGTPSDATDGNGDPDGDPDGAAGAGRKKAITIAHTNVTGDHADFPVWFVIDDASQLGASAAMTGADIHFTRPDGTDLEYELVRWDKLTGHLEAWVKLDLADTQDSVFELRYGDPATAHPPNSPGVFSTGFAAVWHLDDALTTTVVADARNLVPGTALNGLGSSAAVTAKLGGGFDFDGVNDEVSFTNMLTGGGSHTISAWINIAAPLSGFGSIVTVGNNAGGQSRWMHTKFPELAVGFYGPDFTTNTAVATSTSTLVHWVWDTETNTHRLYRNAVEVDEAMTSSTINTTGTGGHIGNAPGPWGPGGDTPNPINGILDEVRIATVPRSDGWIATEYTNQNEPANFYTIGAEQAVPP